MLLLVLVVVIRCVWALLNLEPEDDLSLQGVMNPMNSLDNEPVFLAADSASLLGVVY